MSNMEGANKDLEEYNSELQGQKNKLRRYSAEYINMLFKIVNVDFRYDADDINLSEISDKTVEIRTPIVTMRVKTIDYHSNSEKEVTCYFGNVSEHGSFDAIEFSRLKFTDDKSATKSLERSLYEVYQCAKDYMKTYTMLKPWNELKAIAAVMTKDKGDK